MMTCSSCGGEFNFGPAVVDLRDAEDATLDDTRLPQLAWYHTTTDHGWPLPSKPLTAGKLEALRRWGWPEERLESYRRRHESQAQFYLHRVRLREGLAIEPAWRDENSAEAAATTSIDLAFQGVDVIRYLNAHESIGSLSIAIVRGAIDSVQRVDVPISQLVERLDERMSRVPWNFGGGPMIIRLRSRFHHDGRHRQSVRRHGVRVRLVTLAGAGGR
jgi:hypothetical protein